MPSDAGRSSAREMPPILRPRPIPTRTPQFKCPPGTVDTHIHLFGPAEKYAWDPNTYYVARDATPEMNIALQDKLGFCEFGDRLGRRLWAQLPHTFPTR